MNQSETKNCQNCKNSFTIEPEDFDFYAKIKVPAPTWCPECRMQRRVAWRNERMMYKRKCDATGKEIFSFIHPKSPLKVYERDYWWSDAWDAMDYGRDYDFNRPFFEQFRELMLTVPWPSRSVVFLTNSDYCMNCSYLKNCYMTFHASHNEGCYYSLGIDNSKDCFDNLFINDSELCHECFSCSKCYKVFHSLHCENCQDLYACEDCVNCSDCVGCVGLRNKSYHIFNQPYSKEDYFKKRAELKLGSYKNILALRAKLVQSRLKLPVKYAHQTHNTNVSGEYVFDCKNVKNSYYVVGSEDSKYCQNIIMQPGSKNCYDYSFFGQNAELIYECSSVGIGATNIKFSALMYSNVAQATYSIMCPSSQNLFGCIGLKKKQYCILNKQYSKEEYEKLVPQIIEQMNQVPYIDQLGRVYKYGEFFPPELCPFGYNETIAQEYFPLSREKAIEAGYSWRDPDVKSYVPTISWKDLPDEIDQVGDDILQAIILCQSWDEDPKIASEHNCSKAFKIVPEELAFYRRMGLPLPRRCFSSRHYERTKYRNPISLWPRQCQCVGIKSESGVYQNVANHTHGAEHCPNKFETAYAPERQEIVYCETCYNSEVV